MTERSQGVQDLIPKIPRDERWIKGCKTYVNSPKICCLSNEVDIFLLLSGSIYHNRIFCPLLYWKKKSLSARNGLFGRCRQPVYQKENLKLKDATFEGVFFMSSWAKNHFLKKFLYMLAPALKNCFKWERKKSKKKLWSIFQGQKTGFFRATNLVYVLWSTLLSLLT